MSGVLDGVTVLDLSWGIAGPMTAMLLSDHGAAVTKIEPPGGDPFRNQLGYRVWQRNIPLGGNHFTKLVDEH